jgi:hypothetical protein
MTSDDIHTINRAAAYIDGVLALSDVERAAIARELFQIAGNPIEEPGPAPLAEQIEAPAAAKTRTVTITWASPSERLAATVDHALLIVPTTDGTHRLYYYASADSATPSVQLMGELLATAIAFGMQKHNGAPFQIATAIIKTDNPATQGAERKDEAPPAPKIHLPFFKRRRY